VQICDLLFSYQVDITDAIKKIVTDEIFASPEGRKDARRAVKAKFEDR
jgi:hypothetical protein